MDVIDNGGPAYPCEIGGDPARGFHQTGSYTAMQYGMTLRDYFAAKALAAMIAQPGKDPENCGKKAVPRLAAFAYEYADAMIAARSA